MPRRISWTAALRDLKANHAASVPVREQRLRALTGLRGTPAMALSAWRGRSGRRYVVGVHDIGTDALDATPAVAVAVTRDPSGIASILAVGITPGFTVPAGAAEVHLHRLAETAEDRAAIVADLAPLGVIDGALALLSRPEAWCQGAAARDATGNPVSASNQQAVAWDVLGAVERAAGLDADALDAADELLHGLVRCSLSAFNDDAKTTHADVVNLLRRAKAGPVAA